MDLISASNWASVSRLLQLPPRFHAVNPLALTPSASHIHSIGQVSRCRSIQAYFTVTPSRSTPRLFLFHHDSSTELRWATPQLVVAGLSRTYVSSSYAGAFRNLTRLPSAWLLTGSWKPRLSEESSWPRSNSPSPQSMRHNPRRSPSSCVTRLFPASCARSRRPD